VQEVLTDAVVEGTQFLGGANGEKTIAECLRLGRRHSRRANMSIRDAPRRKARNRVFEPFAPPLDKNERPREPLHLIF
jgi:hypothetical protein